MHVDGTKPVIQRLDRFDLLRGISILLVVFDHAQQVLQFHDQAPGRKMPIVLHRLLFESGPLGVWIFFSISGFLITMTSIRRFRSLQQLRPAAFYRIRFARIAPTLLAVLAVMSLLHLEHAPYFIVAPAFGSLRGALFAALTFQINWLQSLHGWLPLGWLILWSLSVEEMFYLFFPLGCALLRKKWTVPILVTLLLILLRLGPLSRWPASNANERWLYMSYLGNMDMIVIGCIFGFLADRLCQIPSRNVVRLARVLDPVGLAVLIYMAVPSWNVAVPASARPAAEVLDRVRLSLIHHGVHQDVVALATCLLLAGSVLRPAAGSRWGLPLRWMGRASYEIYLTHMFVIVGLCQSNLPWRVPIPVCIAAMVVLSSTLGFLVSRFLSEPANRLLRGARLPFQLRRKDETQVASHSTL